MIDFHVHLDLYPNPSEIVSSAVQRGMYVLSVTTTPSAWKGTTALALTGSRIRTALGLHPQIAHQRIGELPLFDLHLPKAKYVGEIGLDGGPEFKQHWASQLEVFNHILRACSLAGGRIMSIHSRRAASAVLSCLEAHPNAGVSVLHWFSGTRKELDRAVELGCWFSVGPAMLSSENGRKLARSMPQERVLTESDGPFAQIEGRSALPWDSGRAEPVLAEIWGGIGESAASMVLHRNLKRLVGISAEAPSQFI